MRRGGYPRQDFASEPDAFYQFALSRREGSAQLERHGFELLNWRGIAPEVSMKEDMTSLRRPMEWLFGSRGSFAKRALRRSVTGAVAGLCGHSFMAIARRMRGRSSSDSKAKLLLVTGSLECGGSERQIVEMANYWSAQGVDVVVATWSDPGTADFYPLDRRIRRAHLDVHATGRIRGNLGRIRKLRRLLEELYPSAVLSFLTRSNVPTMLAGIGLHLRIVVSERTQPAHETGLPRGWRLLRRLVYRWADAIVCQTPASAQWIGTNLRTTSVVIPNALRSLPRPVNDRDPLIVGVGRLVPEKGFDLLLRGIWASRRRVPGMARRDRRRRTRARQAVAAVRRAGPRDRVEFPGSCSECRKLDVTRRPRRPAVALRGISERRAGEHGHGRGGDQRGLSRRPRGADRGRNVNGRLVPVEDVGGARPRDCRTDFAPRPAPALGHAALRVRERFRQESIMSQWEALLFPS